MAIEIFKLKIDYGKEPIFIDLSFKIPEKSFFGIIGPNGAGKSSIIKAIIGDLEISSGSISIDGNLDKDLYKNISYIPQRKDIDINFPITVKEFIVMGAYSRNSLFINIPDNEYERCEKIMKKLKLLDCQNLLVGEVSGGQFQKSLVARAIMQDKEILILDEPFIGIDHASEEIILSILKNLNKKGKTIVIVNHDLYKINIFTDVALVNRRVIASGKAKDAISDESLSKTYSTAPGFFVDVVSLFKNKLSGIK